MQFLACVLVLLNGISEYEITIRQGSIFSLAVAQIIVCEVSSPLMLKYLFAMDFPTRA
jgi:hypothetical protein